MLLTAALLWLAAGTPAAAGPPERASSIHITSPTGRSGLPGRVRIVARVTTVSETYPQVRFYVGDQLLATDTDGPPYAVEWTDENPFEARRIRVEMTDGELFFVITNGRNNMGAYGANVTVEDRWAIVAYLRALQLARLGTIDEVPQELRASLKK